MRSTGAFHLLELEFIGPDDYRAPDELVEQNDHTDHRGETPEDSARVAVTGGGLQEGTETRQAEIARAEHKHFAGHEKEPSAGDGHHGIPDQPDGGKRQIQFHETLPAAEAIDDCGFS